MGFGSWLSGVGSDIAHAGRAAENGFFAPGDWVAKHAVMPSVEKAGQAVDWLYSNYVSQPISTALMAGELPGGPFKGQNWADAWRAAQHVSPGQALFLNEQQTKAAVDSPLTYYTPAASMLPAGWDQISPERQQEILKQAHMPAVGNAYIDNLHRENGMFKWASGTADFALHWYGDPTVLAGHAVGAARESLVLHSRPIEITPRAVKIPLTGRKLQYGGVGGWSAQDIDKIVSSSNVAKAQKWIYENRANPQLVNNLQLARDSAMGPRFGAIASTLQSPAEVADLLRVGMGDVNAIERLTANNTLAASRIEQDTDRLSRLDLARTKYAGLPNLQALVTRKMATLSDQVNADTALVDRYGQILDHADEIDRINLTRWSFAQAEDRSAAQVAYRTGAARGRGAMRQLHTPSSPVVQRLAGARSGATAPYAPGMVKNTLWGVGDFFSMPVTLVRSLANARPNGYMRIDDINQDSVNELRGHLARIPGITEQTRASILNDYLKTTGEGERIGILQQVGHLGAAKIAAKHGLEPELGQDLYKAHFARQMGEKESAQRFSAAWKPGTNGTPIRVDEFADDGGKLVVHPNLVSRLANEHVLQDLDVLDTVLSRHGSPLRALRESRAGNLDWANDAADYLTHMFKFATLARLGYIPRVLGDDVAGQWARAGSAAMAMRIGWGVRNGATNVARAAFRPLNQAIEQTQRQGVAYAESEMAGIRDQMAPIQAHLAGRTAANQVDLAAAQRRVVQAQNRIAKLNPNARASTRAAHQQLLVKRQADVQVVQQRIRRGSPGKQNALQALQDQHDYLTKYRDLAQRRADDALEQQQKVIQGSKAVTINGVTFPAAFGGKSGQMYQALLSPDEALGNIFASNKQLIHGNLQRSFDHGGRVIRASEDEELHATSWAHAINNQLAQDQLGRMAIQGATPKEMTRWLTQTAPGMAYRKRLGVKFAEPGEIANSAWHEVQEYLPTPEIRQAALEADGVTPQFLRSATPNMAERPEVHTGMVGVQGQLKFKRALDRVVQSWFKVASSMPAERLSRHPLFNQLYEGHLKTLTAQRAQQGGWTVSDVDELTKASRRLALRDTRKLVFDIAHRSDAAAALRFISPFMAPTTEAFQRWGRIIADKPQIVGYAADFFNAPLALGAMQDQDGNHIMRDGTIIDPVTKKRVMVPKANRFIVTRLPKWLVDTPLGVALGVERSSGNVKLSQNSIDLVTQGDPWFNPGVGPVVQIPVNELVKDKPSAAEVARHLGILPFGPESGGPLGDNALGRGSQFMLPSTVKNFLTAWDTSDTRYQSVKLQIMQRAAYEHANLGKPMPSAQKIADMTRDFWLFSAASAFLQPASTQRKDAYQFYRDQYNNLVRKDPMKADDEFLKKFGESYFVFAQSQSQNQSGVPATKKAVALEKRYADLIAKNPELGALVVGPEGNGPFSPEAYAYQLNSPLAPGGAEMQRTKMSASQAMEENQKRLGWAKYTAKMNQLTAQLHDRGLRSYDDDGAADLLAQKRAYTSLYSQPLYPDGSPNPYYNEAWSRDFYSLDPIRYDRLIPGLTEVAHSPLAAQPQRSDLRILQEYLGGRRALLQQLNDRHQAGGAKTITAKANADLSSAWQQFVDGLIESDTRFGDLFHRYLSRDMGVDDDTTQEA